MDSKSVVDMIEASSGPHFSGFHMDGLQPRDLAEQPSTSVTENMPKEPFVIGVAGGAASGKTTVCDMIIQQLHDQRVVLVNQDSFYHRLSEEELARVHEYNFDHPDAFDTEQLLCSMDKLKNGQAVDVPIYDFMSHTNNVYPARRVLFICLWSTAHLYHPLSPVPIRFMLFDIIVSNFENTYLSHKIWNKVR